MTRKTLNSWVIAALEYGPTIGFVVAYVSFRGSSITVAQTQYTGLVAVIAIFLPIFIAAIAALWLISGRVSRIQVATAVMVIVFGGLSVWLNDPKVFKMKPTAIYLTLALLLGIGLRRGQSWLEYIMEDMIPLKPEGWMILTKRVIVLFMLSAGANELVWRTQTEQFWVLFETLVMPLIVVVFFLAQVGLIIDYATFKRSKKKD